MLVGRTELLHIPTRKITRMQADHPKLPPNPLAKGKNPLEVIQLFAMSSSVYFLALISLERAYLILGTFRSDYDYEYEYDF